MSKVKNNFPAPSSGGGDLEYKVGDIYSSSYNIFDGDPKWALMDADKTYDKANYPELHNQLNAINDLFTVEKYVKEGYYTYIKLEN